MFICLFLLVTISGAFRGFHRDILVALSVSPVILPIFLWILGRYSSLQRVNRRYLTGEGEEPHWELRMSIAFSSYSNSGRLTRLSAETGKVRSSRSSGTDDATAESLLSAPFR